MRNCFVSSQTNTPLSKNNKIFFDNSFSSIAFFKLLKNKGFLAVATLRKDRLDGAGKFLKSEKELKKVIVDLLIVLLITISE